ncbi:MAG: sigma-70 family RNA polymerase sigma factor [Prevotella sp.]|nr:sigma-70 family RNA polymerase sigma factor [Prevotella sp.]
MNSSDFEHIAQSVRPHLVKIGRKFFGDSARAEDVAQEVLVRLWALRHRIDMERNVEALAVRMAYNYCVAEWRKQERMQVVEADLDYAMDVVEEEGGNRRAEQMREALAHLAESERKLLLLRHGEEMNIKEMTIVTGLPPRSISAMLSKARNKLIELIQRGGQR